MRRRSLLSLPLLGAMMGMAAADDDRHHFVLGAMRFDWRHNSGRLFGRVSAPGTGWLAVGFNDRSGLAGTRFVIGVVGATGVRAEWHLADPPDHRPIEPGADQPVLRDLGGRIEAGRSVLEFSLPQRGVGAHAIDLPAGRSTHLMLAWSHDAGFAHHSAWRGHADVTL